MVVDGSALQFTLLLAVLSSEFLRYMCSGTPQMSEETFCWLVQFAQFAQLAQLATNAQEKGGGPRLVVTTGPLNHGHTGHSGHSGHSGHFRHATNKTFYHVRRVFPAVSGCFLTTLCRFLPAFYCIRWGLALLPSAFQTTLTGKKSARFS